MYSKLYEALEDEDVYVIDSNAAMDEAIDNYIRTAREKKEKEENKYKEQIQRFYDNLEYDEEGKPIIPVDEEGYVLVPMDEEGNPLVEFDDEGQLIIPELEPEPEGSDFDMEENESQMAPEEISAMAQQMIDDANMEAERIIADANEQAAAIFDQAKEDGKAEGYNQGLTQADEVFHQKEIELENRRQEMEQEYQQRISEMESDLVEMIADIVGKAFLVEYKDNIDILTHLVDNALLNIENSRIFIIKVNEEGFGALALKKDELQARVGSGVQLDVIMDPLLDDGACIIETDGGVFDCSIDTQMNNLVKKLRVLSN